MSVQRFKDSSQRLITRYGATRTYIRKLDAYYDVDSQTMVDAGEAAYPIKMFKTTPKEREVKSPNLVGKATAVMMIAAKDLPIHPIVGDMITETVGGVTTTFMVEVVSENWSGEEIVTWRLVCTRS